LPGLDLDAIVARLVRKEYKSGDVLWRAGIQPDFLGIVQSGEIVVEYRHNGAVIRSVKLVAGECIQPCTLKGTNHRSSVRVHALADTILYVLPLGDSDILLSNRSASDNDVRSEIYRTQHFRLHRLGIAIIAILIVFVSWHDITRIFSGALYMVPNLVKNPAYNYQNSIRFLKYAELLNRNAFFAYNQEGYIWFQHGDMQDAEAAFLKAVDIEQTNGPALNNLAITYFTKGKSQQALILQESAAQNNPDQAVVQYNLGLILMNQNANTDAMRAFKEASYIDPKWTLPYLQRGFIHLKMQNYIQAEQAARTAIQTDSSQQSAYLILAIALYNQEEYQDAQKAVEQALQMHPNDNVGRFYKALILSRLGNTDSALIILQQLLESSNNPQYSSRIEAEAEAISRSPQNHLP
jgi:tetratricopeptide (TPR) repeat protein